MHKLELTGQALTGDHEDILLSLKVLEQICYLLQNNVEVDPVDIIRIIYFLKIFADECHHGKEEEFLFPVIERAGLHKHNGIIRELLSEHESERRLIRAMQESMFGDNIRQDLFIRFASDYIILLRSHIEKERSCILQSDSLDIPDEVQDDMVMKFTLYEERIIGKDYHKIYHTMLKRFEKKYLIN